VLRVGAIVAPCEHHDTGAHEAGEVVDVAVRLVVDDAAPEPDDALGAEVVAQHALDLAARKRGVAVGVEQALFCCQHSALAVDVDRAALEHDRCAVALDAFDFEHLLRDAFVAVPLCVEAILASTPRVELPIDAAHAPGRVDNERRPDVAHPRVVARQLEHPDPRREHRAAGLELRV
jgi:hypothetical protein